MNDGALTIHLERLQGEFIRRMEIDKPEDSSDEDVGEASETAVEMGED